MNVGRTIPVLFALAMVGCGPSTSSTDAGDTTTAPATASTDAGGTTTSPATASSPPTSTTTTQGPGSSTAAGSAITTFVDLAGTYEATDGVGYLWLIDDETVRWAFAESGEQIEFSTMFQGTSVLLTDPDCGDGVVGEYEFRLLEGGDVEVVLLQDACPGRAGLVPGVYVDTG